MYLGAKRRYINTLPFLFLINPLIFTPDALPAATLSIILGLGQAEEYAGLHTPVQCV